MAPSNSVIESTLRDAVVAKFEDGDLDNLTLKRIRASVVSNLQLAEDFFKTNAEWSSRSKNVVNDEVARQEERMHEDETNNAKPKLKSPVKAKSKVNATSAINSANKAAKRKSGEQPAKPVKKRKTIASSPAPDVSEPDSASQDEQAPPKGPPKRKPKDSPNKAKSKRKTIDSSPVPTSPAPDAEDDAKEQATGPAAAADDDDDDDLSDLSELIDEAPTRKPKTKKKRSMSPTAPTKVPKSKKETKPEPTPAEVEITRLKSQLAKCGIRKVWGSYLKPYETPQEKIRHLRGMLEEVGMTGRFSEEKAARIREERELKADLEEITMREEKWGKKVEDGDGEGRRPRVAAARGLEGLEGMLDSEESD